MLKIDPSRQAARFLRRVNPRHGRRIARKIEALRSDPEPRDSRHLKGKHAAFRRAVVGAYRVIYRVEGDTLRIYLVGKRNDAEIYRRLEPMPRAGGIPDD